MNTENEIRDLINEVCFVFIPQEMYHQHYREYGLDETDMEILFQNIQDIYNKKLNISQHYSIKTIAKII